MNNQNMNKPNSQDDNLPEEEMTVDLELDSGTVTCSVLTIFNCEGKDYIALLPQNEKGEAQEDEVWIYGYSENENDPDEEPSLRYIDDDEEYEKAADAFDEYLDNLDFEDMP